MLGTLELERVAVVVFDVESLDAGLDRCVTPMVMVTAGVVRGRMAYVGMVEVKPAHLAVVVCRSMHVRGPGDQAERQVRNTADQCHGPTHPAEYTRRSKPTSRKRPGSQRTAG